VSVEKLIYKCRNLVKKLNLDLSGLIIITECASHEYLYTPVIAALAGAKKVYAVGKDTRYGKFDNLKNELMAIAVSEKMESVILPVPIEHFNNWPEADIITNSGAIRPINAGIVKSLKPTCVIPLMWETWEFRSADLDISACQQNNIAVIGTNESFRNANMYEYPGLMILKALLDTRVDPINDRVLLLGGGLSGSLIAKTFKKIDACFDWATATAIEENAKCYSELNELLINHYDAIVIADHISKNEIIGRKSTLSFKDIFLSNPYCQIIHFSGNIDKTDLFNSGLSYYPDQIADVSYMSFLPNVISATPILTLNAAGLKVGEIASRALLAGCSVTEAIQKTVQYGIGQDFEGGFFNFIPEQNHD